jgi:hypothetical protein
MIARIIGLLILLLICALIYQRYRMPLTRTLNGPPPATEEQLRSPPEPASKEINERQNDQSH